MGKPQGASGLGRDGLGLKTSLGQEQSLNNVRFWTVDSDFCIATKVSDSQNASLSWYYR